MGYKTLEETRAYEKAYRASHREKIKEYQSEYRSLTAEKRKEYSKAYYVNNKARRYGLTPESLHSMFVAQNEQCAICSASFTESKMCIDHDHSTGKVRGLLCFHCNTGLGHFKDSAKRIQSAIAYLENK